MQTVGGHSIQCLLLFAAARNKMISDSTEKKGVKKKRGQVACFTKEKKGSSCLLHNTLDQSLNSRPKMASSCRKAHLITNDRFVGTPATRIPTDSIHKYQKSEQYIQFGLRPFLALKGHSRFDGN
ncbi:hypothetical protein CXF95_25900 [Paraglaciecola sp. MB-3u-78]|nr:hypothetical protein CXF95_25900 [Paraglaciecola sp. MB-3u-78]